MSDSRLKDPDYSKLIDERNRKDLIKAFNIVDEEKSGKVNINQLAEVFREWDSQNLDSEDSEGGVHEDIYNDRSVLRMVFTMADINEDYMVSLNELLILLEFEGTDNERTAEFVSMTCMTYYRTFK